MSLLLSLLLKADARQAKAELRSLSAETAKGKAEVTGLGNAAATADSKLDGLASASASAAAANDRLAQTQTRVQMSTQAAAASMGNLVANFNDVGVMIAAGQNPLQLAIQQGTQITQVIGPMGAGGAVKALGGALVSMLSPINLVTIGSIAFGTWAIQAFMGGADAARSFTEEIDDARAAVDDLRLTSSATAEDLREDFGAVNADIVEMQAALGRISTIRAFQAHREALAALKGETEGSWWAGFTEDRFTQGGQIAEILGTDWLVRGKLVATKEVANFRKELATLETAQGPRAQMEIFRELQRQMLAVTGGIDQMTLRQMAFYEALVGSEQQARQLLQAQLESAAAAEKAARAAGSDNGRQGGPMAWDLARPPSNVSDDLSDAQELLATLKEEASIRELIIKHGRDSEVVALARLEAERAAFVEMAEGMDVAQDLKLELIAAFDAAKGVESVDMARSISLAADEAERLFGNLSAAAQAKFDRQHGVYSGRGGDPRQWMGGPSAFTPTKDTVEKADEILGLRKPQGARKEKDAVADLIAALRDEMAVLAEADPVKREMLKHRKALAEATVAERAEVEGLIRAEQQLRAVQAARDYAADAVGDFLDQIIAKGGKASDVLRSLATQFLSMAARSVLSGSGWFADLLGISGGIFGGGTAAAAIPALGKAAATYQPVMARVDTPMGKSAAAVAPQAASAVQPIINVNVTGATGNAEIRKMTAEGIKAGLQHYDTHVLPTRVDKIIRLPRDR